jgi:3-oxoacyl-[acyl-carrier-protein] synthase-1
MSEAVIAITAAAAAGPAGASLAAHLGAVQTRLACVAADPVLTAPGPDGRFKPVMLARAEWVEGEDPTARCLQLLDAALAQLQPPAQEPLLLQLLLAGPDTPRGAYLDEDLLRESLAQRGDAFAQAELALARADGAATQLLAQRRQELADGRWAAVVFGGVDSLIDAPSVLTLARQGRVLVQGGRQGWAPAEGAALVLLERGAGSRLARLDGLAAAPEPNHGLAESAPLLGLRTAIERALAAAGLAAEGVSQLWTSAGANLTESLEWHQVRRALWQPRLEGDLHHAMELGLLEAPQLQDPAPQLVRLDRVLGDWGAAALPLHLALAAAALESARRWQRFGFAAPAPALVCETGDQPVRGAVCLQP